MKALFVQALEVPQSERDSFVVAACGEDSELRDEVFSLLDSEPFLRWHSLFDQRFDQALEQAGEAQRMMPQFWALVVQGWAHAGKSAHEESIEAMRDAVELKPDLSFTQAALAHALARNGQRPEAERILRSLLARERRATSQPMMWALVYAGLDQRDEAFAWLERAIAERSMFVVHLTWDSRLQPLRDDPRFNELEYGRQAGASRSRSDGKTRTRSRHTNQPGAS